jgi:hypothetical protein
MKDEVSVRGALRELQRLQVMPFDEEPVPADFRTRHRDPGRGSFT